MELRRISDQVNESLVEYFEELGQSPFTKYRTSADRMIRLLHHLEENIDAPMQWATTSHFWFYFGSVDHWDPQKARVFVYLHIEGFEIRYRSTEQFIDWTKSFEYIHATNINEAADAIKLALQKAVPNPAGRWVA